MSACSSGDDSADGGGAGGAGGEEATVTTKLLSFEPQKLTVEAGTTVTWTDSDEIAHTVTTGTFKLGGDDLRTTENPDGTIDEPLSAGQEVSYTFTEPGTYTYYCSIHKGMTGEIVVTP